MPERFSLQKDIKGCYHILNNKAVNHQMLQKQHYENVLEPSFLSRKNNFVLARDSDKFFGDGNSDQKYRSSWTSCRYV